MKTKEEIIEVIKRGVNEDLDIEIKVVMKEDYTTGVLTVLGDSDTVESYIEEMEKEVSRLERKNFTVTGFEYKID